MDIDELCDDIECWKGIHVEEDEMKDLRFSNILGFSLLLKDPVWISRSFARYRKYIQYINMTMTDQSLVVYHLMRDFIKYSQADAREDPSIFAAKILVIDKLMEELVINDPDYAGNCEGNCEGNYQEQSSSYDENYDSF
jgi:hypothetical protein